MMSELQVRRRRRSRRKEESDIQDLTSAGHSALQEGRTGHALTCFSRAMKTAAQLQDSRLLRACCFNLGAACVEAGLPQRGLDLLTRAQSGPKADRMPDLQFNVALAHNALGHSRQAATCFLQAAQLYRSQGGGASEGDACSLMSHCYSRDQLWSLAVQGFLRAADSYRVSAMLDRAAVALSDAGSHMIQSEEFGRDDIISVLRESLSLTDSVCEPRILGELYLCVGVSFCRLRCFPEAVQCFLKALPVAAHCPPLLANLLHNLGAALNSEGQFGPAATYSRLAAGLYGSLGCRGDQARCFCNLANACGQLGDEDEETESFLHALQGFRDTEEHLSQVQVCVSLAECYLRQRKQQKAVALYRQALTALTHCQESSGSVGDHLVERLTAALQSVQRQWPPRPRPLRPPVGQLARSPGRGTNQQPGDQQGAEPGELVADGHTPPTDSEASLIQEAEAPPTHLEVVREAPPPAARWRWSSRFCSLM